MSFNIHESDQFVTVVIRVIVCTCSLGKILGRDGVYFVNRNRKLPILQEMFMLREMSIILREMSILREISILKRYMSIIINLESNSQHISCKRSPSGLSLIRR
jgi:hypothetical protein